MEVKYFKKLGLLLMAVLILAGCKKEDGWEPGPEIEEGNMSVYFEPLSSYDLKLSAEDDKLVEVNVSRIKTDDAATVKLNLESVPEGVVVPEEVKFEAEQKTVKMFIDLSNMPEGVKGQVKISLPSDMSSPYTAGSSKITLDVYLAPWITIASKVTYEFRDQTFECVLQMMEGTNIFRIPDFMGSGLDFVFRQETPGLSKTNMILLKNIQETDYGWALYDEKNGEYPEWSPDGAEPLIYYMDIQATGGYCVVDFANGYIYIGPTVEYTDGSWEYADYYFRFTLDFNPFE